MIGTGWCGIGPVPPAGPGAVSEAGICDALLGLVGYCIAAVFLHQAYPQYPGLARAVRRGAAALRLPHAEHPGGTPVRIARALFWTSGAATAWVLAGYPAALGLLPRRP